MFYWVCSQLISKLNRSKYPKIHCEFLEMSSTFFQLKIRIENPQRRQIIEILTNYGFSFLDWSKYDTYLFYNNPNVRHNVHWFLSTISEYGMWILQEKWRVY